MKGFEIDVAINSETGSKLILRGTLVGLAGYILSGPVGTLVSLLLKPQPAWESAQVFAANYHFIQDIPFYLGFLLVGGMLMIAAGHFLNAPERHKANTLLSFAFTVVFAALIFFNYICQTTFVRQLAINYRPENDAAIAIFSMVNPSSLCWAIEMWGYGVLGVATWLLAGYYNEKNKTISRLLVINGVVSIGTAVLTAVNSSWLMTTAGLVAFMLWNVLMITLMILMYQNTKSVDTASLKIKATK